MPDEENIIFDTAAGFINKTNAAVFLTGKAGTGKTTFLKFIKENCRKNTVVVAPTGVAAINAGGTTIHSFFQLPFGPFLPVNKNHFGTENVIDKHNLLGKLRLSAERKEIMQQLELLIIDEISMVRCDVLDAIDLVLRHVRKRPLQPFGGVQVLYIGDMYQLPPVVKDEEWRLLSSCYANQYFFSSLAVTEQPPVYIELKKVYRQSDELFINLLNKVRSNEMDEEAFELLHSRYLPDFKPGKENGFITLTTHNAKADEINSVELSLLPGTLSSFKAVIDGEFTEKSFPADEQLTLKVGAQVMFIKNDTEKIRRYYNGKIGTIEKIDAEKIWVTCKGDYPDEPIEVKKETWRNIKYSLNNKTMQVEEEEVGSFTQFPLRLAWAITIHKSQGLSFEKAIIDAGKAFAPGQVYVALSRCTALGGIVLHSRISKDSLHNDDRILAFTMRQKDIGEQNVVLNAAEKKYQHALVKSLFDFSQLYEQLNDLTVFAKENNNFGNNLNRWLQQLQLQINTYRQHSAKFEIELEGFFTENILPEENKFLGNRLAKAGDWFLKELTSTKALVLQSPATSDNRQLAKDFNSKLQKLFDCLCYQIHVLDCCKDFSVAKYNERKACFEKEIFGVNTYSGKSAYVPAEIPHPELFLALKDKREALSQKKSVALYMICSTQSLEEMATYLPKTLVELGKINGFGKIKLKQFGKDFLSIIQNYAELHKLESSTGDLPVKKVKPLNEKRAASGVDTKRKSLVLYKEGKNISEIATERGLVISTIESHLTHFVSTGELNLDELMDRKKQSAIIEVMEKTNEGTLQSIKEQLPDVSYNELRWVIASRKKLVE